MAGHAPAVRSSKCPLYNAMNTNLPTWVADNGTVVVVSLSVFLCPSANNPTPDVPDGRRQSEACCRWRTSTLPEPITSTTWAGMTRACRRRVNLDDPVLGCNGPIYRNSSVRFAGVTDGLSNTVFASEKTPFLADASWVGIIPGYRHFANGVFASLGTGGPGSTTTTPAPSWRPIAARRSMRIPVVIHPPNSPLGHTDEMYSLHPGGANVLMGDGSVRFIRQSINLLDMAGSEQPIRAGR